MHEEELIERIGNSKRVLLIEPLYRRKYMPLGLAKIAAFVRRNGGKAVFRRDYSMCDEDLICVGTLFTYQSKAVLDEIGRIRRSFGKNVPMVVGGIYASLMPDDIKGRFPTVEVFKGYSRILDSYVPDYEIDWGVDKAWDSFSYVFTTRGCPNRCPYCATWRIEDEWVNPTWKEYILKGKPNVMVYDNNLSAQPRVHVEAVLSFLADEKKGVLFDNGFDIKYIDEDIAGMLGRLRFVGHGMRIAFDRIEEDGMFQEKARLLEKAGVPKNQTEAYVLFNFTDTPKEAEYRMREYIKLGIRPYPQQYIPLNVTDRKSPYIGKYWTKNLLRVFRFFYLMAGFYNKMTFEEYVKEREIRSNDRDKLSKEDWEKWYGIDEKRDNVSDKG